MYALQDSVPKVPWVHGAYHQSMEWIELKRSSPVQIHEPLILIQSNPSDDPESESGPVQSGHNRKDIYAKYLVKSTCKHKRRCV